MKLSFHFYFISSFFFVIGSGMPPHVVLLSIALGVSSISHQRNAVRVMAMALFFLLIIIILRF